MRNHVTMGSHFLDSVLQKIIGVFSIVYGDFTAEGISPIGSGGLEVLSALIRGKSSLISCPPHEEARTWAHEGLGIYYYRLVGVIRHDDEVEAVWG